MKKVWLVLIMLCLFTMVSAQGLTANAASAPKVSIEHYKIESIQYAVIKGEKYKAVNMKMKNVAKEAYKLQKELDKQLLIDKKNGSVPDYMEYFVSLTPVVKYKSSTKVSILNQKYIYKGGYRGDMYFSSFNVYKGKNLSLKGAFKSNEVYLKAKKYAKAKIVANPTKYPLADAKTTIAGHPYYWTKTGGIKVVFSPDELATYNAGPMMVSIPAAYMMK